MMSPMEQELHEMRERMDALILSVQHLQGSFRNIVKRLDDIEEIVCNDLEDYAEGL